LGDIETAAMNVALASKRSQTIGCVGPGARKPCYMQAPPPVVSCACYNLTLPLRRAVERSVMIELLPQTQLQFEASAS